MSDKIHEAFEFTEEQAKEFEKSLIEFEKFFEPAAKEGYDLAVAFTERLVNSTNKNMTEEHSYSIEETVKTLAVALTQLASLLYTSQEEFINDLGLCRTATVDTVIPSLCTPVPCQECENCLEGDFDNCTNPSIDVSLTTSRRIFIIAGQLLEYDIMSKFIRTQELKKKETDNE